MTPYYLPHILLIDDDEDDTAFFEAALTAVSVRSKLTTALSCRAALHLINNKQVEVPDVIFADLQLPGINGFDCINLLKQTLPLYNVPIVVISDSVSDRDLKRLWQMGVSYFIRKPPSVKELEHVIAMMVNTQGIFEAHPYTQFFVNK